MRIRTLLFFLCLFLPLCADEYEMLRVGRLEIIPCNITAANHFDARAVRAALHTKTGSLFSQAEFDEDLKTLALDYACVEPEFETVAHQLHIVLKVWLKPSIREILFCGNEHISTRKLRKELEVDLGASYDQEGFLDQFNGLRHLYIKKGFFESELNYEIIAHPECNEVTIKVTVCEGRVGKIRGIDFCGVSRSEEREVLDLMVTKKYNFLLTWYIGGGVYNPEMIEHDRLLIIDHFQNQGYADAIVDMTLEEDCNGIRLAISIDRGQCYTIGHMALQGNCTFTNKQIWDCFLFGTEDLYSPEKIRDTMEVITTAYGAYGFIDASVDIQLTVRPNESIYDLCLTIEEGERLHVGMIKVFGNCGTKTSLILHETLLCPGEVFDIRKLKGTEARLTNTGYFKNVNVYAVKSQYEDESEEILYRDVFIEVEEADTGNVSLFFGFSSLEQLFGGVEIAEQNFNISGIAHVLENGPGALRGAGEYAHFKINVGDRQTSYLAQWTKPYFLDTPWIVGVDLEKNDNRALSHAYEIKTYGGSLHATYICNAFLKYNFYYRATQTFTEVSKNQNNLLRQEGADSGFVSALGINLIYDSTDHPRLPTHGFRSRFLCEVTGLGGNYDFFKFAYLNSYYYPMTKKGTLKLRAELQFIQPFDQTTPTNLPLGERLFLGGETTVRGYRPFVIGPLFANLEPRGGVSSLLLSEEYQYNLLAKPRIDAFAFVDAGMISLDTFTVGRPAASVGFGTRLDVMNNMPMMLGVGWPIHPVVFVNGIRVEVAQRFFFSMGGMF